MANLSNVIQGVTWSSHIKLSMDNSVTVRTISPFISATLIFMLTALVGVWAAPDRSVALLRYALFIVGLLMMIGIAYGTRYRLETLLGLLGLGCGLLAMAVSVHFLFTVNWVEVDPGRLRFIQQLGVWLNYHAPELSKLPNLHKNITGGVLIILLPFCLGSTIWASYNNYRLAMIADVFILLVVFLGLLMTISHGAFLGFGLAVGYTAYFIWRFRSGCRSPLRWLIDILVLIITISLLASFFLPLFRLGTEGIPYIALGKLFGSRADLWQDSLAVIQDYPFTGSGLGNTAMVYSSYLFLLHVPFLAHAHSLLIQIAIEQGLPGLIAFIAIIFFAGWGLINVYRHSGFLIRVYCAVTFASLIAMLGHGLVEAGVYAHLLVPIVFLPFGFTLALLYGKTSKQPTTWSNVATRHANCFAFIASLAPPIVIVFLFLRPGAAASLQANLGAVSQARAELAVYHWPEWPLQDELRQKGAVDLSPAIAYYNRALALDPANVTAHRRLGQIAISMGQYEIAQDHLETAFKIAPQQRATRQMLGEIYAVQGEVEKAVQLWKSIDISNGQLDARYWWHTSRGKAQQAEWLKQAIDQLNHSN